MAEEKQKIKAREVTIPEMEGILKSILKTEITPFLWGPPGVGKSSIVKKVARDMGWKIIDLRLSLLNPVDLRGLPTVNHAKGEARWLPPSFLPAQDATDEGVLFLDEINLSVPSVQAAAYQLILDKQVGEYKFPRTWRIVAAGNRETDKANVYKLAAPLANRFIHFTVRPDFYSWKEWASQSGVHETLVHFLTMRPAALFDAPAEAEKAFPSPRSWEFVSTMLDAFDYDESKDMPDDLIQVIFGAVGEGTGREMIEFFNQLKMKELTTKIDDFIKTGNITMPRGTSQRLTVIGSIFEAYASGKIDQVKYDAFNAKLTGEERATIKEFEEKNADKLKKKFKNHDRKPAGEAIQLAEEWHPSEEKIYLETVAGFDVPGTILVIHEDGKKQQIVGYEQVNPREKSLSKLTISGGVTDVVFPVGSTVNKLG